MAKCKFCGAEVVVGETCKNTVGVRRRAGIILEQKRNRIIKRKRLLPSMLSMMILVQGISFIEVNIT